jgi:hypothetical protein
MMIFGFVMGNSGTWTFEVAALLSKTDSSELEKWKGAGMEPAVNFFYLGMSVSAYGRLSIGLQGKI